MSKGSRRRNEDQKLIDANWERTFSGKRPKNVIPPAGSVFENPDIPHVGINGNLPFFCHACDGDRVAEDGTPCPCTTI